MLFAVAMLIDQAWQIEGTSTGSAQSVWERCAYDFADRIARQGDRPGRIADRALDHCARAQAEYRDRWVEENRLDRADAIEVVGVDDEIVRRRQQIRRRVFERVVVRQRIAAAVAVAAKSENTSNPSR